MQTITGDKTNETFNAQDGVSYNGQGGFDTLVFTGVFASYDIDLKDTGNIKTDVSWASGALDTKWIERFVFSDGVYNVATDQFIANPTISISNGQAIEGQAVNFTISLSHATDHTVTVTYFTQQGSAAGNGTDYFGTAGTQVTIPAGQTSVQISIQTRQDTLVEANEQFFVNLTSPTGATIADGNGVGTILNDDVAPPPPHITMTAVTSAVTEGGTISYLFERSGGDINSAFDVTWDYLPPLPSGAATPGVDFIEPATKVIHFAAGQTQATLNFVTIADGVYEGTSPSLPSTEAFAITFVPDGSYTFAVNGTNIATIVDGDSPPPPPPTISISDGQAVEGQPVTFTISLSHATDHNVSVTYATQPGTAFGMGNDFFGTPGTTVTIAAGQTSAQISIATVNDPNVEPNETFFVNLSNPAGGAIADGQGVGTILNNDFPPPLITMTAVTSAVTEGGTIQYLFQRTGGDINSAFDVTWQYNPPLPSGAATPGVDFVDPASHVIHFAPGQTQATLDFLTIADGIYEGISPSLPSTEAFAIAFVPNGTYTFAVNGTNIATIVDGDAPLALPTISVSQNDAVPGAFGNIVTEGDDATFTFTRDGNLTNALTVEFQIGSAPDGGAMLGTDFNFAAGYAGGERTEGTIKIGSVTFAAGSATATLTLDTIVDGLDEGLLGDGTGFDFETFTVGVWPGTATTYLTDLAHSTVSVQLEDFLI